MDLGLERLKVICRCKDGRGKRVPGHFSKIANAFFWMESNLIAKRVVECLKIVHIFYSRRAQRFFFIITSYFRSCSNILSILTIWMSSNHQTIKPRTFQIQVSIFNGLDLQDSSLWLKKRTDKRTDRSKTKMNVEGSVYYQYCYRRNIYLYYLRIIYFILNTQLVSIFFVEARCLLKGRQAVRTAAISVD